MGAVGFLSRWTEGTPIRVKLALSSLGLNHPGGYAATDIFTGVSLGVFNPSDNFVVDVNPTGIRFIRFNILPTSSGTKESNSVRGNPIFHSSKVEVEAQGLTGWRTEL